MKLFSLSRLLVDGAKPSAIGACVCTPSIGSSVAMIAVQHGALASNDGET